MLLMPLQNVPSLEVAVVGARDSSCHLDLALQRSCKHLHAVVDQLCSWSGPS